MELVVSLAARPLTRVNMGLVPEDWTKWWETAAARFEFDNKSGGATTRTTTPDLTYFGIEVSSKRVSFLLDASNGMLWGAGERGGRRGRREADVGERKIDVLKKELERILRELPDDTEINII